MITCNFKKNKGFTLVELMISVGIFALMTGLLLAKYGTFNQGILLTNLAYDVALTLRTAQSYGLNVKSAPLSGDSFSDQYDSPYGVHFSTSSGDGGNLKIIFFADNPNSKDGLYTLNQTPSELLSVYSIKRGSKVQTVCSGDDSTSCVSRSTLDITFKRPDPDALINWGGGTPSRYAEIVLRSSDGGMRKVIIRATGQIAVSN